MLWCCVIVLYWCWPNDGLRLLSDVCVLADKLSQSRERELRRALFSLKQMFQVDDISFK